MANVDADVWVLTETHRSFAPGGTRLIAESCRAADRTDAEAWVAVWARDSSVAQPMEVCDPERCASAVVNVNAEQFAIYGTVLPWLTDARWPVRGYPAFSRALNQYADDWASIRRSVPTMPLVLAGDFNQDLASFHYYGSSAGKELLSKCLASVALVPATAGKHDPLLRFPRWASIDHICATPEILPVSAKVWPELSRVGKALTDHFGVVVEYARPN